MALQGFSQWLSANVSAVLGVLILLVLGLAIACIWLNSRVRKAERLYQHLATGVDGGNLQTILDQHVGETRAAVAKVQELERSTRILAEAGQTHLQHVSLLRYNPFRETGGDQSFVLALADGAGDGVILSSLHTRDITRVYGKPLAGWDSTHNLTDEERQAIDGLRGRPTNDSNGSEHRV